MSKHLRNCQIDVQNRVRIAGWINRILLLAAALCVLPLAVSGQVVTSKVDQSKHNLSARSTNTIKSSTESGVCIFCHAPHNTSGMKPLWNRPLSSQDPNFYTTYKTSPTFQQVAPAISDRSKLCLSCHDGTIALGQTVATGNLGLSTVMSGASKRGPDLTRDHPISFNLPAIDDGEIKDWLRNSSLVSPDAAVQLYDRKIECVTCHDPHTPDTDPVAQNFLVRSNEGSGLCLACHDTARGELNGTMVSAHALASGTTVNDHTERPYATVAANLCLNCHNTHTVAGSGPILLIDKEENTCAKCHGPNPIVSPAAPDVMTGLTTPGRYAHPIVTGTGMHQAGESLPVQNSRHSECEDCHNPHASKNPQTAGTINPPALQASVTGARGMNLAGTVVAPATNEYEVCLKCHGKSNNKPQKLGYDAPYGRTVYRDSMVGAADPYNKAADFQSTISRHNVALPRSGYNSPSLRINMADINGVESGRSLASGNIYCSDCHNSDTARSVTGTGTSPNGPHSSKWPHLLERRYDVNTPPSTPGDNTDSIPYAAGSSGPYGMCDKCHDVDRKLINGGDTVFGRHQRHVVRGGISCSSCHNPHGVQGSDTTHHGGLVDIDAVMARRQDNTPFTVPAVSNPNVGINTTTRNCNLTCHGHQHNNKQY